VLQKSLEESSAAACAGGTPPGQTHEISPISAQGVVSDER
jgi:hypothetical protein